MLAVCFLELSLETGKSFPLARYTACFEQGGQLKPQRRRSTLVQRQGSNAPLAGVGLPIGTEPSLTTPLGCARFVAWKACQAGIRALGARPSASPVLSLGNCAVRGLESLSGWHSSIGCKAQRFPSFKPWKLRGLYRLSKERCASYIRSR
jgi:hypothetical protein